MDLDELIKYSKLNLLQYCQTMKLFVYKKETAEIVIDKNNEATEKHACREFILL